MNHNMQQNGVSGCTKKLITAYIMKDFAILLSENNDEC